MLFILILFRQFCHMTFYSNGVIWFACARLDTRTVTFQIYVITRQLLSRGPQKDRLGQAIVLTTLEQGGWGACKGVGLTSLGDLVGVGQTANDMLNLFPPACPRLIGVKTRQRTNREGARLICDVQQTVKVERSSSCCPRWQNAWLE